MAYSFVSASSQYLSASAPVTGTTFPFSMACRFWCEDNTTNKVLMSLCPANGNYFGLVAFGAISGHPVGAMNTSYPNVYTSAGYSAQTWHSAAAVYDSHITVYLDGGASGVSSEISTLAVSDLMVSARRFNGALVTYGGSIIAEAAVWNAALTAAEIASLANGFTPAQIRPQSLVFYAPLVRDLIDAKGGRTLTNNNAATVAAHPRVYQ